MEQDRMRTTVELGNNAVAQTLAGEHDAHLKMLEQRARLRR